MKTKILHSRRTFLPVLFTLLLSALGVTNAIAQTFTVGDLIYTINDDGASVTLTGHVDGISGELVIPESVELYGNSYPVTAIGDYVFYNYTGLSGDLVIPNSVISIGHYAFDRCFGFTSLTIPESVAYIGFSAFVSYFTVLNYNAINCSVYQGWLPNVSTLTLTIGENVQVIPNNFLKDHSSTGELVIPNSVISIGDAAFENCTGFTGSLTLPNSVISIGNSAFNGCTGFTGSLTLPNSVISIGNSAFENCTGFTGSLTIPNSVETIGTSAFSGCSGFSGTLTLGNSLTQIDNTAFFGACENFTSFNVLAETPPTLGNNVFLSVNIGIPVFVLCGSLEAYQNASGWSNFINLQESNPCLWGITATTSPSNGGSVIGAGIYEQGQTCTLTATAHEDYAFESWTEDGIEISTDTEYSFTVTSNRNLVANFRYIRYEITVSINPEQGGTVSGIGNYLEGETCTLTAMPNGEYAFENWTEDGMEVSTDTEYSFTVTSNRNLVANFRYIRYEIIVFINPEQGGTVSGIGNYLEGETCTLTATPNEEYAFVNWTENGEEVSTETSYSFAVAGDRNLMANFRNIRHFVVVEVQPEEGGTVSFAERNVNRGQWYYYDNGNHESELGVEGNDGKFWWGVMFPAGSYNGTYLTKVSAFDLMPMSGTLTIYNDGTTAPANQVGQIDVTFTGFGDFVEFNFATPVFVDPTKNVWVVFYNESGASNPAALCSDTGHPNGRWLSIDGTTWEDLGSDYGYYFTFMVRAYIQNIDIIGSYLEGETCTLMATPNEGYEFVNWTEDGQEVSTEAEYSFTVLADRELVANFSLPTYTITATVNPNDGGWVGGIGSTMVDFENSQIPSNWSNDNTYPWLVTDNTSNSGSYSMMCGNSEYEFSTSSIETTIDFLEDGSVEFYSRISAGYYDGGYFFIDDDLYLSESGNGSWTHHSYDVTAGTHVFRWSYENGTYAYYNDCYYIDDIVFFGVNNISEYELGETCTLTAIPYNGYTFENWTEDGNVVSTEAWFSFVVTSDRNLVANFVQTPFSINATPNFDDRGTVSGAGEYVVNETCTLTAIPNDGHNFVHWMENGEVISTEASYSFTVTGPRDLTAVFTAHVDDIIVFADPNVKAICVNNWDTDGDGELSYDEAAMVTNLGSVFQNNTGITSFEELQYFVGLTSINNYAFSDCSSLTGSLIIPNSVIYIREGAFKNCNSLASVTLPEQLVIINNEAFYNCYSLTNISFPENLNRIGNEAFYNCCGLRGELTLPKFLGWIGEYAFAHCDEITTINYNAYYCSVMGDSQRPVFYDCPSIVHINIGANVLRIPNYAFKRCSNVVDIIVAAEVPPTIYSSTFGTVSRNIPVSVPMGSGEAYRTAPYWEEFFHITEDYSPNSYTYHWNVNMHQFASNMTVTGINQIEGVEQSVPSLEIGAFCNGECRGRQLLTYYPQVDRYLVFLMLYGEDGDVFNFRLYDHEAGEELTAGCASVITFEADAIVGSFLDPYVFNFTDMQLTQFSEGWNWWSTYVEQGGIDGLSLLQESLGDNGVAIRSQASGYTDYYEGYGWYGSLESINNESSYRVVTSAPCVAAMPGSVATPSQHPITLSQGWTWIGYLPSRAMDINAALEGLEATQGDMVKSQQGYSDYYPGYGWFGSLNTVEPGMGLMYYLSNGETVTFTYPDNGRGGELKANLTTENNHWKPNTFAYPDNMTVMAVVELNEMELKSDNYELAAFANGECRGSVKLTYAEPLNRHVAFLTISGKDAAELSFRLYDMETGMEYYDAEESLDFVTNAIVGTADDLYTIHFRNTTGMDELASQVQVYPNPVNTGERFSINVADDVKTPVRVEIVNALGIETLRATSVQMPAQLTAPATAGIYTLRITVEGKGTVVRKLVVK